MEVLTSVANNLKEWNANVLGDLQKRIKEKRKELEHIRRRDINPETVAKEHLIKKN